MKIAKLLELAPGLTIRQVHYWRENGWFGPEDNISGQGNHVDYSKYHLAQAQIALVLIKKLGMTPRIALHIASRSIANPDADYRMQLAPDYYVTFEIPNPEN